MDNTIKATLKMRYDTYENWFSTEKKEKVLEQGEIGFCLVEGENSENLKPGVYFKVGNNVDTYETLPWFTASLDVPDFVKTDEAHFIEWINKKILETGPAIQNCVKEIKCPIDYNKVEEATVEFIYTEEGETAQLDYDLWMEEYLGTKGYVYISVNKIKSRYLNFEWPGVNNYSIYTDIEIDGKRVPLERDDFGNYMIPTGNITGSLYIEIESLPYEYDGGHYPPDPLPSKQILHFISAGDRKVRFYIDDKYECQYALKEKWILPKYLYSEVLRTEPEVYMNVVWKCTTIFNEIFTVQGVEYNKRYFNHFSADDSCQSINVYSDKPLVVRWAPEGQLDLNWTAEDFIGNWKTTDAFFEQIVTSNINYYIEFYSNGKFYSKIQTQDGNCYFDNDLVYYNGNIMNTNYYYFTFSKLAESTFIRQDFYTTLGYYLKQHGEKKNLQKNIKPGFYSISENITYTEFVEDMPEGVYSIKFKSNGEFFEGELKKFYIGNHIYIYLDDEILYSPTIALDKKLLNFASFDSQEADYNMVVWLESKMLYQSYDTLTADNRCSYKLYSTSIDCAVNGIKDAIYNNGLHFPATYYHLNRLNSDTFDIYIAADKTNVYVLYEMMDTQIVSDATNYYHNDCADFIFSLAAENRGQEIRIFGKTEGDENTALYYIDNKVANASSLNAIGINHLYVKHTDKGYNVEFSLERSKFTFFNKFSFLGIATCAFNSSERTYPYTVNAYSGYGDSAKEYLNEVVILDAPDLTQQGCFAYRLNAIAFDSERPSGPPVQYEREKAYRQGLKFNPIYNLIDDNNTFTLHLGATNGDSLSSYLLVKYEVKDESIISASETSFWWNDCIDFIMNIDGSSSGGKEFRIEGNTETTSSNGKVHNLPDYIEEYSVIHTDDGYNVEFIIPRSALINYNAFSFMALITAAVSATSRKYPCIENAAYKEAKDKLNFVQIIDDIRLDNYLYGQSTAVKNKIIANGTDKLSIEGVMHGEGEFQLIFYDENNQVISSSTMPNTLFNSLNTNFEYWIPEEAYGFYARVNSESNFNILIQELALTDNNKLLSNYDVISKTTYTADQGLIDIPEGTVKILVEGTYNNYLENNSIIKLVMANDSFETIQTHNFLTIDAAPSTIFGLSTVVDVPDMVTKCGFDATGEPQSYDKAFKCNINFTFLKPIIPISNSDISGTWSLHQSLADTLVDGEYSLGFVAQNDMSEQWEEANAIIKADGLIKFKFSNGYISSNISNNITIFDGSFTSHYFKQWILDNAIKVKNETSTELIGLWEMRDEVQTTFNDIPLDSSIRVNFLNNTNVRFYCDTTQAVYIGDILVAKLNDYGGIGKFTLEITEAQKIDDKFKAWFLSHFTKITQYEDLRGVWKFNGFLGEVFYDSQGKHYFDFISGGETFNSLSIFEPFSEEPTITYDDVTFYSSGKYEVITIESLIQVGTNFIQAFKQAFTKISDIPNNSNLCITHTETFSTLTSIPVTEKIIAIKTYGEITPPIAPVYLQCIDNSSEVLLKLPITSSLDDPQYFELHFYLPNNTAAVEFVTDADSDIFGGEFTVELQEDILTRSWTMNNNGADFANALNYDLQLGHTFEYIIDFTWNDKNYSSISIRDLGPYGDGDGFHVLGLCFDEEGIANNLSTVNQNIFANALTIEIHKITSGREWLSDLLKSTCTITNLDEIQLVQQLNITGNTTFNLRRSVNDEIIIPLEGEILVGPSPKTLIPLIPIKYDFGKIGLGDATLDVTYTKQEPVNKADFIESELRKEIEILKSSITMLQEQIDALKNTMN